jgi:hypothetical protein
MSAGPAAELRGSLRGLPIIEDFGMLGSWGPLNLHGTLLWLKWFIRLWMYTHPRNGFEIIAW